MTTLPNWFLRLQDELPVPVEIRDEVINWDECRDRCLIPLLRRFEARSKSKHPAAVRRLLQQRLMGMDVEAKLKVAATAAAADAKTDTVAADTAAAWAAVWAAAADTADTAAAWAADAADDAERLVQGYDLRAAIAASTERAALPDGYIIGTAITFDDNITDLRRLIADDVFAATFQTLAQYRDALLSAAAQMLPDPEPTTAQLLQGAGALGGGQIEPETAQLVDGRWWETTRGNNALQQVVNNARALWRSHINCARVALAQPAPARQPTFAELLMPPPSTALAQPEPEGLTVNLQIDASAKCLDRLCDGLAAAVKPDGGYKAATTDDPAPGNGCDQMVQVEWWVPQHGCDSLENTLDAIKGRLLAAVRDWWATALAPTTPTTPDIRAVLAQPKPVAPTFSADSLIDRVAKAIYDAPNTREGWRSEARAAILEVASWFRTERDSPETAAALEQEANR